VWYCPKFVKQLEYQNSGHHERGREASETIMFTKDLPQSDALCPRLFTVCLNPIAWKISASDGYRLSKPIDGKAKDLPNIDDLTVFAISESKLTWLIKAAVENVGLQWNSKKCAVLHIRRRVLVVNSAGVEVDEGMPICRVWRKGRNTSSWACSSV